MKKSVTLIDIAKACNTSNVTVSKALAGKSGVSRELRDKIKRTAEEMGYVPAKSSLERKKGNIGVLIPEKFINPNGSFYWALYNSLVQCLKKENLYCILENLTQSDEDNLVMPNLVKDRKISGLISLGQLSGEYVRKLYESMPSMMLLDYYVPEMNIDAVITNGYNGGYKLASYLIKMGHTKIGYIGRLFATTSITDRYMGYLKAMIENGLSVNDSWIVDDRDRRDFIEMDFPEDMPTAFVCNCDEAAFNAIKQLKAIGYSVPDDISVVGYDNYLISEVSDPTITTVDVDAEYMAQLAVQTMIIRIEQPDIQPRIRNIDGELVIKDSVRRLNKD
ncbi:LacI family DNA-binding transcriptional regulator [Ruminococcus sp. Marseille-P6503]|uniref:LacI family DNA-binding transcriptional regulator n=1 Tax=Ruminococcus sp. Marseille-P6503 TaxID=2364796 RepID=UPI000F54517E|nr:LacI family DNA-binding transcriptional regulator [Ruminococcus sp. Marseille-P6503]